MKIFSLILFLVFGAARLAHSGEFTGAGKRAVEILEARDISWQSLETSGHALMANGEFTGGGKSVGLPKVKYIVSKDDAYTLQEIDAIVFKRTGTSVRPSVEGVPNKVWSDVDYLESNGKKLSPQALEAVIYKK